jgi:hypothetical protein
MCRKLVGDAPIASVTRRTAEYYRVGGAGECLPKATDESKMRIDKQRVLVHDYNSVDIP